MLEPDRVTTSASCGLSAAPARTPVDAIDSAATNIRKFETKARILLPCSGVIPRNIEKLSRAFPDCQRRSLAEKRLPLRGFLAQPVVDVKPFKQELTHGRQRCCVA